MRIKGWREAKTNEKEVFILDNPTWLPYGNCIAWTKSRDPDIIQNPVQPSKAKGITWVIVEIVLDRPARLGLTSTGAGRGARTLEPTTWRVIYIFLLATWGKPNLKWLLGARVTTNAFHRMVFILEETHDYGEGKKKNTKWKGDKETTKKSTLPAQPRSERKKRGKLT